MGSELRYNVGMYEELSGSALRVARELRRLGINSEVTNMPESTRSASEAAAALGCGIGQIVKSLIFRSVEHDEPILVLASGADRVDEARLSGIVGGAIEQASGKFVRARTGFAIGGIPPVGHQDPLTTYLDEHLLAHRLLWAAAGTPHTVFSISAEDLVRASSAIVVAVAAG